ncbi:MAG: carboxypeptidase regulatory-like domain-containing protein [Bacteroidales bacterium]|nr:carboxypeptidase regulatory-like domain-containing protein [Bacteroidales bacterium]
MKKVTSLFFMIVLLLLSGNLWTQCLTAPNGQWPSSTYTNTVCDGTMQVITTCAYTGEYSVVSVIEGNEYQFQTAVATNYLTISNSDGTVAYAFGTTPVTWTATFTGDVRFYRHISDACDYASGCIVASVSCTEPLAACLDAPNGQWPSSNYSIINCNGTPELITSIAYTGEYSLVNVVEGNTYEFSSSVGTDYLTIANETRTEAYAVGTTPVTWEAAFSGVVSFIRHLDDACNYSSASRSVYVSCAEPSIPVCLDAPNGLYPSTTFTNSVCDGTFQTVTSAAWGGEYSKVNVIEGNIYVFNSSVATDYLTIADELGTEAFIAGTTPVEWTADFSGVVRFYRHSSDACDYENVSRTVQVSCAEPPVPVCLDAPNGLYPSSIFTNSVCDGTFQTVTTAAWTGEYSMVNVTDGNTYVFSSSVATDYITIGNESGIEAITSGTTPLEWLADFTGVVRFYRHSSDACDYENVSRTVRVSCLAPPPGDDCNNPIIVDTYPYMDLGQTTCGHGNSYDATCLGSYDGGEDIMYEFTLTESWIVTITMDPKLTTWTGMLLTDICPPEATCIATVSNSGASVREIEQLLEPGTYYIMIDTWPDPDCIPDFDLSITLTSPVPPGILSGTVTDLDGNPLEGVTVNAGLAKFEATTNASGFYEFLGLEPGFYDVTFDFDFYESQLFEGVEVVSELTTTLDAVMLLSPPPFCPDLVYPGNDATNILPNATLEWAPAGPYAASGYRIYLFNTTTGEWVEENTDLGNVTTYTPAEPLDWGSYYAWLIVPYNLSGETLGCTPWFFFTSFNGTIAGTITDTNTGLPIEDATVLFESIFPNPGFTATEMTEPDGTYAFNWESGTYKVTVSKFGYQTKVFNNIVMQPNQTTTLSTTLTPYIPYTIPFVEGWDALTFAAQQWSSVPNWLVGTLGGEPVAAFIDEPRAFNYSRVLQSFFIDGRDEEQIYAQFDLDFLNYSSSTVESLTFMVNSGNGWQDIYTFDNQDGSIPWSKFTYDISGEVAGKLFLLGFRAEGADSWNIWYWVIDNILVTTEFMDVNPSALYEALPLDGNAIQQFSITNLAINDLLWEASFDPPAPWLILGEMNGSVPGFGMSTVDVTFDAIGLAPGTYNTILTISAANGLVEQSIPVTLEVYDEAFQKIMIPGANSWGYVSTYVNLDSKMMLETALADILEEMIIMIGTDGIFWPGQNINTLGEWDTYKGYKLKMGEEGLLVFFGDAVENKTVSFPAGVHIIPVLSEFPVPAADIFGGHDIEFAFDLNGGIYWPFGQIYTLETLEPGYGYLVKFNAPALLDFDVAKSNAIPNLYTSFENTTPWNNVYKTGDVHIVGISAEATSALQTGDVVGIFNPDGVCTGMSLYTGKAMAIAVFGDDLTSFSKDGMSAGEPMSVKVFSNGEIIEVEPVYNNQLPNADGLFAINGLSMITSFKGATGIGNGDAQSIRIYPNPSNGLFTIDGIDNSYKLVVMNSQGQLIYTSDKMSTNTIDLTNQPTGVYFIRLIGNDQTISHKVIIQ